LLETFPAKNGAPLRWAEGNGGLFVAVGADGSGFDLVVDGRSSLAIASVRSKKSSPFRFAELTTLGLVFELLVVEK